MDFIEVKIWLAEQVSQTIDDTNMFLYAMIVPKYQSTKDDRTSSSEHVEFYFQLESTQRVQTSAMADHSCWW